MPYEICLSAWGRILPELCDMLGARYRRGRIFAAGKQYLWDAYIDQGGNPDAQERP